jgi:beta-galactosidase
MNKQTKSQWDFGKLFPMGRILFIAILFLAFGAHCAETVPLAGKWRFALDRKDVGTNEQWFAKKLPDRIKLPGVLEAQGYGDKIGIHTPWVMSLYDHFWYLRANYAAYTNAGSVKVPFLCQPPRHYLGAAWYQRDIEIPTDWQGKRMVLFLERPHWKTTVWLDDKEIGSDIGLCTPHEYDLGLVPPGKHRLTICVDNRMQFPDPAGMHAMDAHSVSDSLDNAWNGIVGKIELRATPSVWVDHVRIFTDATNKTARVFVHIGNATGKPGQGSLSFVKGSFSPSNPIRLLGTAVNWQTNGGTGEITFSLGADAKLWDEFDPALQNFSVILFSDGGVDSREITFGLRDFHTDGNQFILNGRPIYFRGTHFGGDFPLTGYPATDVESWKRIFQTCKNWGLNHMRFHSWCPPEAAFEAADELGFYLQVECGMWNDFSPGGEMEKMLYAETERILRTYGNHPSFVLLSASNEAHGNWKPCLTQWVEHFRSEDPRRLYTPDTGWSLIDEPGPVTNVDYLATHRIGLNLVRRESGWFGRDYSRSLQGVNVPVIGHEVGQWVAYPDFDVIKKFTGFMQPGNYEIFRDSAAAHGLLKQDKKFAWASGRFQLECYKEEIEANLRTPGLAGFQLLDLHDYTGQGTALVGLLDPFWESKGYATRDEFEKFCNTVVPLARLRQRTFTTADKFEVPVEVANFGATTVEDAWAGWRIENAAGEIVAGSRFEVTNIPVGRSFALGTVSADLSRLPAPAAYRLVANIRRTGVAPVSNFSPAQAEQKNGDRLEACPTFENGWNFWLYPAQISDSTPTNVFVTRSWDEAEKKLSAGGRVLYLPRKLDLNWWSPPMGRTPVFWNALMGPTWSRMMGLWCNTNHPALAEFPTEANCDWQWTELVFDARAVNLDRLPHKLQPIVQAIDDWNRNYKLGVVFECKVGAGKLMVCSIDLDSRPGAQQLRRSLLDYMGGKKFKPQTKVSASDVRKLLFDTRIMQKLGATAEADGRETNAFIDGDPNTFWLSSNVYNNDPNVFWLGADAYDNGSEYPHELTVHFPQPVAMNGLVLMPRQNQREHQGDIHDYTIQVSDDGNQWREITHGQLASTFDPQQIRFSQTITAKHLKLTALSGFGNDTSTSLAELAVIYAGPKIADNSSGNVEYQGVRTASPDIDAGTGVSNKPPKSSK